MPCKKIYVVLCGICVSRISAHIYYDRNSVASLVVVPHRRHAVNTPRLASSTQRPRQQHTADSRRRRGLRQLDGDVSSAAIDGIRCPEHSRRLYRKGKLPPSCRDNVKKRRCVSLVSALQASKANCMCPCMQAQSGIPQETESGSGVFHRGRVRARHGERLGKGTDLWDPWDRERATEGGRKQLSTWAFLLGRETGGGRGLCSLAGLLC